MENSMYFVISILRNIPGDNGINIACMTQEKLVIALEEREYGEDVKFTKDPYLIPDPEEWPEDQILIIKGEIVVPKKTKRVVRTYEL